MKYVTIKDVAKKLNISISSVSRAFNDKYDIKKETKELILKTAKEMGYQPNPIAKKLIQQKSFTIGVVVPEFINEFYSEVIYGIQETFIPKNYQVLITSSAESTEKEMDNVNALLRNKVDGLIISPTMGNGNYDFYLNQINKGQPIVFLGRVLESMNVSKVILDNKKWSFFATEHLIYQGYKKIYYLSGYEDLCISKYRVTGFKNAMKKHRIPQENFKVLETGLHVHEAEKVVQKLIQENDLPEAFCCVNDVVAFGSMKALRSQGINIPDDIAIMGFSEVAAAQLVHPTLSSVKQPTFDMGRKAAELLLKQIETEDTSPETIILEGKLNARASTPEKLTHA